MFSLALPMLVQTAVTHLTGFVNSSVLSSYSQDAVAASGAAVSVINILVLIISMIVSGASVVLSHNISAVTQIR